MPTTQAAGYSLVELLFALAISATLVGIAVPLAGSANDEIRTAAAARRVAGKISTARVDAVRRSTTVGLHFETFAGDVVFTTYADGNGNGVRTAEIRSGVDPVLRPSERIGDTHAGVRFGLLPGIPDLEGASGSADGVRIGPSGILSLSPTGGATSGTLYLHGWRRQYAVRILGATGRVRVFHYNSGARQWNSK